MFGKKRIIIPGVRAMHADGLDIPANQPCGLILEKASNVLQIVKFCPDLTLVLPLSQVKNVSLMGEAEYMTMKHGGPLSSSNRGPIFKFYMVIDYLSKDQERRSMSFWTTAQDYGKFLTLQESILSIIVPASNQVYL